MLLRGSVSDLRDGWRRDCDILDEDEIYNLLTAVDEIKQSYGVLM
jgi:hypothetical protein